MISDDPIWIKGVLEEITKSNNIEIEHTLTVNGQTYQYEEVDALISVVTRDDQFTEEFRKMKFGRPSTSTFFRLLMLK